MEISRADALRRGAVFEATTQGRGESKEEIWKHTIRHVCTLAELATGDATTRQEWARLEIERLILVGRKVRQEIM